MCLKRYNSAEHFSLKFTVLASSSDDVWRNTSQPTVLPAPNRAEDWSYKEVRLKVGQFLLLGQKVPQVSYHSVREVETQHCCLPSDREIW